MSSATVRAVEEAARCIGYCRLHLFKTSAIALRAGLGWRALERHAYRGDHIQVMDRDLSS
jgi:hypothetical protein